MDDSTRSWKKCVPKESSGTEPSRRDAISMSRDVLLMSEYVTGTPSLMSPRLPQRPGPIRTNRRFGRTLFSRPTARPTSRNASASPSVA